MSSTKEGHVVRLERFRPEHGKIVFRWFYDPAYRLFFRDFEDPLSLEQCKKFDKVMAGSGVGIFMIIEKSSDKPIGMVTHCCLKKKSGVNRIGIMLDKDFQHKTYAIEALIILLDYLYNRLGFKKIIVEYLASDHHIQRISEKGGWIREAVLKREAVVDGEYVDEVRYYMFKETYEELYGDYFK
ncbi:MAG: GNAT family N-acetyltransferase [Deltaproteobacteria bacterium]|nr:GNAT family N-acetyltransferase [Deltaproteobacteria bacterium]